MRWWPVALLLIACEEPPRPRYAAPVTTEADAPAFAADGADPIATDVPPQPAPPAPTPARTGPAPVQLISRSNEFAFDGGNIELDLTREGDHLVQWAVNHYAVPVVVHWEITKLANLGALSALDGVIVLPPAATPMGDGTPISLADLSLLAPGDAFHRDIAFTARFGNPRVRPRRYAYRLPYPTGKTFSVLQGFHGAFSHRGSDEYAVDFDCPVATPVLATRPGMVVATHASAQGAGITPDYLDYKRTNFVLVLHDDGTLGEYMHLAPAGVEVRPGDQVTRGQELALSGHTGYSSTPHLHFQVMTAGTDGVMARSFPFTFALAEDDVEEPVEGQRYAAWE